MIRFDFYTEAILSPTIKKSTRKDIIGTGLSEDLIVLNCNTTTIGYINSSKFYSNDDNTPVEEAFVDTHLDLGTFYYRSMTEGATFMGRAEDVARYLAR